MDGIILAGGKGTRMRPLTLTTPKPLLAVQGRPILEWSLLGLRPIADHVLIVVNYLKEQIADYMARQTIFERYTLVEQTPEPLGTGHALQCCRPHLQSHDFLVHNGDDLFGSLALQRLAKRPLGILTMPREDQSNWAVALVNDKGALVRLHEKPQDGTYPTPVQANIGAYKLDTRIFDYELPLSARGEYELPDYITYLAGRYTVDMVEADFWFPIGEPAQLAAAQTLNLEEDMLGLGVPF
jgi:UDP-N-acetylglucosamine diphosphorylase / glucose-1-phosphate thymidylyltransferase / UDP-N-acetylgalactosamine diphosphorylase / glucosamine-1-phosphate N-acetyltransferase / galactosamine-1-phosphate N-acetyltransferase